MEEGVRSIAAERPPWVVRIMQIRGAQRIVVGAGFLIDARRVLTCAHVVVQAVGGGAEGSRPTGTVHLDFPQLPGALQTAQVGRYGWVPVTEGGWGDVAVLELGREVPPTVRPAPVRNPQSAWEHRFRVLGFPVGMDGGLWVRGTLLGMAGPALQWIQLEHVSGPSIERGFSGAPVWDDNLGAVVGMVVARDRTRGESTAFMIPATVLSDVCPGLSLAGMEPELVRCWPLPRVADADPYELGVLNSARANAYAGGGRPPYVPRLHDDDIRSTLRHKTFIAVKGPSHAGKSRTAFEAACATLPDHRLVVPRDRAALGRLARAETLVRIDQPLLVWLDDLERYLGADGLDMIMLSAWAHHSVPIKVLGTIRVTEYARLRRTPGEIGREIALVFNYAEWVWLESELYGPERTAVQELYPGERFEGGFGEHLAAAHELVQKFQEGYAECPVGYAIVQAAVDWRRAGLDLIPLADLKSLYRNYFKALRPLESVSDEDFERGLNWATAIEGRTAVLLVRSHAPEERFRASDYIVDYVEGRAGQ
jgi:hypothetical protein